MSPLGDVERRRSPQQQATTASTPGAAVAGVSEPSSSYAIMPQQQQPSSSSSDDKGSGNGSSNSTSEGGSSKRKRRKVALPDVDDVSMNRVSRYMENYEQDLFWSFLSDTFFIVGGILYLILSVWDYAAWPFPPEQEEEKRYYFALDWAAPTVYLLNSVVDMKWAMRTRKRRLIKEAIFMEWGEWRTMMDEIAIVPMLAEDTATTTSSGSAAVSCGHRFRKHAAHRRTILAALTFGIAALFAVVSVLARNHERASTALGDVSDHVYVVSAVIALSGKRTRPWLARSKTYSFVNNPYMLEDLGDLFFLIGSIMDSGLDDFNLDAPVWYVVSSVLWLLDALFYLRSDFVMAARIKESLNDDNEGPEHVLV